MEKEWLLETSQMTKQYGKHKAVDQVNLHVKQGAIYGLIGRNGAGKTTILRIIGGLASPTQGDYSIFGKASGEAAMERTRVGALVEEPGVYPDMTARQNLKVKCLALGVRREGYIEELLQTVGLADTGKKKVRNFSLGMRQRLGIALALVGDPDLLILDEPINGLDPQGFVEVRETLVKLNKEKHITIVISSHILEELSKFATHYGIIHNGTLLEELTREELLEKCCERIELKTNDTGRACTVIEAMGIRNYQVKDEYTIHIFERLEDSGDITMALARADVKVLGIAVNSESLEEYFLNLTGGGRS